MKIGSGRGGVRFVGRGEQSFTCKPKRGYSIGGTWAKPRSSRVTWQRPSGGKEYWALHSDRGFKKKHLRKKQGNPTKLRSKYSSN